ncbi:hypothetical protein ACQ4LE_004416 [Meloidogyne hapla]|uniref:Uncharacterized protein n=1 Tax=Meloidogyne hapla TaxID=6305 RepID=A0A1I8B7U1_MELHA
MKKVVFADLNIKHRGNPEQTLANVKRAMRMGYDAVVINIDIGNYSEVDINNDQQPPKKKKKNHQKKEGIEAQIIIPDPFILDESKLDFSNFLQSGKRFRQFSRLTVTLNENSVHKFQHDARVKKYDIIAVRVPDEQLLLTLQRKGDFVDLITLDGIDGEVGSISWLFKQKIVQSCINVGIYFEITYSKALQSSERRRQLFSCARKLIEITRGGNGIVLSSAADELIALRAPYDVGNLSTLFGLPPESGRRLISENVQDVLLRAQTRKTVKGAIYVANLSTKNPAIPSASGQDFGEIFNQLSKIEEFKAEMNEINEESLIPQKIP